VRRQASPRRQAGSRGKGAVAEPAGGGDSGRRRGGSGHGEADAAWADSGKDPRRRGGGSRGEVAAAAVMALRQGRQAAMGRLRR